MIPWVRHAAHHTTQNHMVRQDRSVRIRRSSPTTASRPRAGVVSSGGRAVPPPGRYRKWRLRPIPMGRWNWLFAWTELGAERVGTVQGRSSSSACCMCSASTVRALASAAAERA